MGKTETRLKRPTMPVPQDADEVSSAILTIGENQREVARLTSEMNAQLSAIKTEYELRAAPHVEEIKQLGDGVHAFCEAHRVELTSDGKVKTAKFSTGECSWRLNPPKVVIKRGIGLDTIFELLRARRLKRFIRVKEELDKEAILSEPGTVTGMTEISVEQSEQFVVKPFGSEIEAFI